MNGNGVSTQWQADRVDNTLVSPETFKQKITQQAGAEQRVQQLLLVLLLVFLLAAVFFPLLQLFSKSLFHEKGHFVGLGNFIRYFSTPFLVQSLYNTVGVSALTTVVAVFLGFTYAYALSRTVIPLRTFFKHIALLPLFAPTMMHGIALIYLFGKQGVVTTGLFGLLPGLDIGLYGATGIVLAEIFYVFPQAFLIFMVALSSADYRLYEAAEILGAGRIRKFFTVTLPGVKYGFISAVIVCFTLSFSDFGAPKVVGGQFNVLATDIYKQVIGQQNMSMGATVGSVLLIPAVVAFIIEQITERKQKASVSSRSVPYRPQKSLWMDRLLWVFCLGVATAILVLMGMVVLASLFKVWPYDLSLTLRYFNFDLVAGYGFQSYFTSLKVAGLTAVFGTAVAFVSAYMVEKTRPLRFVRQAISFLSILPLALPGMVLGLSYIFFFNQPEFLIPGVVVSVSNPLHWIYGSLTILALVNIVHFLSVPFITATTALKRLDAEFELVAESMAIPFYRTFSQVTVPICFSAILEIGMYFFVNSMVTISAVIFLYAPELKLASIAIVNMDDAGDIAAAAAMSVLIVLTNILVRVIYGFVTRSFHKRAERWQSQ